MVLENILILMPMFVSLFWAMNLCLSKKQNITKKYLAFFLFVSTLNYFTHALFFNREYGLFAFFDNIWFFTSLGSYPLYYYYIRLLTKDEKINLKYFWILAPAVVMSAFSFTLYFSMSPQESDTYIRGIMYHELSVEGPYTTLLYLQKVKYVMFKVIFALQVALTFIYGRKLILEFNSKVTEFYSNTSGKNLSVVNQILSVFIFTSVISLFSSTLGKDFFIGQGWMLAIPSVTHSVFLFWIGYVGFYQDFTIKDFNIDTLAPTDECVKTKNESEIDDDESLYQNGNKSRIIAELDKLMTDDKMFKNSDVRISDLVTILGTNRTYLSQIINEEKKMNFCEWINSYRAEYAKSILEDASFVDLTIIEISEMSGFSSRSVFYRVFKDTYGVSPGNYRNQTLS